MFLTASFEEVMIWYILAGLAAAFVLFLIFVATRPNEFRVERSILLNAGPQTLFPYLNDLHRSNEWSPWAKLDPNMKLTYEGPQAGPGASYSWDGNKQVGAGRLSILESTPDKQVKLKVEFLRPFASTSIADQTLSAEGPQTKLTWGMNGTHNFISKLFCLFMNMDKMIGKDFEKGLNNLKTIVEGSKS
jgi:hypothetical protein